MIEKLELLLALAREKHFGRAAEACGISQPSFSAALKTIEEQLGVRIVERGSRFQGFTPEGERILEWARRIVGDARTMRQEISALKQGLSGPLRLGVIPTALPFVPALSVAFAARHPDVKISIMSMTSDAIVAGLDNLELEAGISYIGTDDLPRFRTLPLYEERYALVVAPENPIASRSEITWAEAGRLPLCLLTPDMKNRRIIDRRLSEAGATPSVRVESNSMTILDVHVKSGSWATIAALGAGHRFEPPMGLKAIAIVEPVATHEIGLIINRREPPSPVVSALLSCVKRVLPGIVAPPAPV